MFNIIYLEFIADILLLIADVECFLAGQRNNSRSVQEDDFVKHNGPHHV